MPIEPTSSTIQDLESEREYVSDFGAEGAFLELSKLIDPTIDRILPDVPGTADDVVRRTLKRKLSADARERGFCVQWTARMRVAIGPFAVTTNAVLREVIYTVRTRASSLGAGRLRACPERRMCS
jgi:hypothetical protein